jgi:hypothetical protein
MEKLILVIIAFDYASLSPEYGPSTSAFLPYTPFGVGAINTTGAIRYVIGGSYFRCIS